MKNKTFLYDTHCHANSEPLLNNFDEIIKICQAKKIIFNCVGTNYQDSLIAIDQAKKYPYLIKATIGIHPSEIKSINEIYELEKIYLQNKKNIVAWGEIGLDYHGIFDNKIKEKQKIFFQKQVEIASKYNLPIILHLREQNDQVLNDAINILDQFSSIKKVLIHFFTGDQQVCEKIIKKGYFFSLSGVITYKSAIVLNEVIKSIPLDKLMIETDCPFVSPIPYRSKVNQPYFIEHTYEYLNKKLGIKNLDKILLKNSLNFFDWEK